MTHHERPDEDEPKSSTDGTTFVREGPAPSDNDTGESVDDMNRAAEDAWRRNIRPDERTE